MIDAFAVVSLSSGINIQFGSIFPPGNILQFFPFGSSLVPLIVK